MLIGFSLWCVGEWCLWWGDTKIVCFWMDSCEEYPVVYP